MAAKLEKVVLHPYPFQMEQLLPQLAKLPLYRRAWRDKASSFPGSSGSFCFNPAMDFCGIIRLQSDGTATIKFRREFLRNCRPRINRNGLGSRFRIETRDAFSTRCRIENRHPPPTLCGFLLCDFMSSHCADFYRSAP